jgi:hypothetical protein
VAQLLLVRPRTTLIYQLELDGQDHLVGRYGHQGSTVDLRRQDGVWSGPFGYDPNLYRGTADLMGDGDVKVMLTSTQWGVHPFVIHLTTAGDVEVRGSGGFPRIPLGSKNDFRSITLLAPERRKPLGQTAGREEIGWEAGILIASFAPVHRYLLFFANSLFQ